MTDLHILLSKSTYFCAASLPEKKWSQLMCQWPHIWVKFLSEQHIFLGACVVRRATLLRQELWFCQYCVYVVESESFEFWCVLSGYVNFTCGVCLRTDCWREHLNQTERVPVSWTPVSYSGDPGIITWAQRSATLIEVSCGFLQSLQADVCNSTSA